MEKEKNDKVEPDKAPKENKPLTEEQRIKRNKMIAIPCMCLVCALVLWLIFKPSASEGEKGSKGFNMEMPDAEKTDVEADKRKAYSKEDLTNKQKEKSRAMNTLGEYMPGIDSTASGQGKDFDLMQSGQQPTKAERQEADAIRSSAEAREHVRRFHELFFTLSPEKSAIEHNVKRALLLADKSAYNYYQDFAEKGFYNRLIAGNINQSLQVGN